MFGWIEYVFILIIKAFIPSTIVTILLALINRKFQSAHLKRIIKFLFYIPVTLFFILILVFFILIFTLAIWFVYHLISGLLFIFIKNHEVSTYLSLVISLVVLAYFPDSIGRRLIRIYERIAKTGLKMEARYSVVVKFIRFKLWIYLAAFILMLLSTTETILQKSLLSFNIWLELKPVIFQSVVTFITLDRFLKLLSDEWRTIEEDSSNVVGTLKSLFMDLTSTTKDDIKS